MLRATVDTIVSVTGGQLVLGEAGIVVNGLAIDSREASPGCAFVALPGERVDGHDFVRDALDAGARLVVVTRAREDVAAAIGMASERGVAVVRVADAVAAVQALAAWHRTRLHCPVIGVTGSTGKTTTKDFLRAVLGTSMKVVSTEGNRNNELGVPLTVLNAGSDTDALVVEMGMRGLGQIAALATVARPTVGLVTNVGQTHIEVLGTQDAITTAKGELVASIPVDGAVFLNGDDAFTASLLPLAAAPVTLYGLDEGCSVRAENITLDDESKAMFTLQAPAGSIEVALPVPGRHNVYNALAAAAVGLRLGVTLDEVVQGLENATLSAMRMQIFTTAGGITVINDAYNASPASMRAAVDTLAAVKVPGKRIAVLGDMAELGSLSELAHFRLGEDVGRAGLEVLVTVGERAARIAEGAKAQGMNAQMVRPCSATAEASEVLDDVLEEGDAVLVKASRVMGLEVVVEGIVSPRAG